MAFKGGTSLSKAHGAIERFSEDVDLTIDYRAIDRELPALDAVRTSSERKRLRERLQAMWAAYVHGVVRPHFEARIAAQPEVAGRLTIEIEAASATTC